MFRLFRIFKNWDREKASIVDCMTAIIAICNEIMDANNAELLKANAKKDFDAARHIQKEISFTKELLSIANTISTETRNLKANKSTAVLLNLITSNIEVMLYHNIAARRSSRERITKHFQEANSVMSLMFDLQPAKWRELFSWRKEPSQSKIAFVFQSQ